jgi:hypothetical protein
MSKMSWRTSGISMKTFSPLRLVVDERGPEKKVIIMDVYFQIIFTR